MPGKQVTRGWIRSDPKVFRVNITALLRGIEESVKNIRENNKELMDLAPEFFTSPYTQTVDGWILGYAEELKAMWEFHKNDPKVK